MMIPTVPSPDPMPLPAPVWLLKSLLLLTFFLHVIAMNFALGGGLIAMVSAFRGRTDERARELSAKLAGMLPPITAFAITLGVAALLFLQVLYGQFLYASSILIGVAWIMVIPLLIIGYYSFYAASLKHSLAGSVIAVLMLLTIAFIYVNNMSLMLAPDRWLEMYKANAAGWHLNVADTTFIPRFLHMILGATAVGGVLVVILGLRSREPEVRDYMLRLGALWFVVPTVANFAVGFWFLLALRTDVRMLFMGQSPFASALLGIGVLLSMAAIVHLLLALSGRKPERQAIAGIGAAIVTVAAMIGMRDIVRSGYLSPVFSTAQLRVAPQWSVIGLFLVLFVVGLATLYWMVMKVARADEARSEARVAAAR